MRNEDCVVECLLLTPQLFCRPNRFFICTLLLPLRFHFLLLSLQFFCGLFSVHYPSFHSPQLLLVSTWRERSSLLLRRCYSLLGPTVRATNREVIRLSARQLTCRCCSGPKSGAADQGAGPGMTLGHGAELRHGDTRWHTGDHRLCSGQQPGHPTSKIPIIATDFYHDSQPKLKELFNKVYCLRNAGLFNEQIYSQCKVGVKVMEISLCF